MSSMDVEMSPVDESVIHRWRWRMTDMDWEKVRVVWYGINHAKSPITFHFSGHETFGGGLNCLVHVFMYSYYFLAALGPQMQPYLWWKRYLTTFQMVQFCCIFVKSSVVVLGIVDCAYPWQFSLISMGLVTGFFGLFFEFYVQEYRNKAAKKKAMEKAQ